MLNKRNKRILTSILCFFLSLSLTSCAIGRSDFVRLNPGTVYSPKAASAPIYLTTMGLEKPYEEIGFVHMSIANRDGYDELNELLREEARRVGADAIIFVTYGTENAFSIIPFVVAIPYDVLFVQGLAVRYKKK